MGGNVIKACPNCKAPQLNTATICKVCKAPMSQNVKVDLFAESHSVDRTQVASITPTDIMEMSEQMESTPVYEDKAVAAPKDLNPYETSDPNEPTLIEKKLGVMLDRVEGAMGKGSEVPNTLKALIAAQEAFEAKDYQLAASHLSGIEKILELELLDRPNISEVPIIAPVKRGMKVIKTPAEPASPTPVKEAPKTAPDLDKAIDDLFSPSSLEVLNEPSMNEKGSATPGPVPEAKPMADASPAANKEPKKPESQVKETEPLPKRAPSRILRPKPAASPQPEEKPAKLHQRKTVDLRSVQDDDSGSLSVTKKRESGPKSQGLNLIFLSTEARLALSEGKIAVAREKYDQILAQDASNKEALDFKAKYPMETLTKNLLKNLEAQAIEAFLQSDYSKALNLYMEILKASPKHKRALEGVEQCESLLKKRPD